MSKAAEQTSAEVQPGAPSRAAGLATSINSEKSIHVHSHCFYSMDTRMQVIQQKEMADDARILE
jgi:hypothetical protein